MGAIGVAGLVAVAGATALAGMLRWRVVTARARDALDAGAQSHLANTWTFSPEQVADLPAPARHYCSFALRPSQPLIRRARFEQEGEFAMKRDAWKPFTAVEDLSVYPPAFVWDARIRMAPLLAAFVCDRYIAGEGVMQAALAGLVPVVDQRGTPSMAMSSLLRYLAETPWLPTALLPNAGVRWTFIDDGTARAMLTDAGITVSMDVHFGPRGEIERIEADRHRDVEGTPVLTRWVGHFYDYERIDGMMVPARSEVGWVLADGWFPYWRGRMVSASFEFTDTDDTDDTDDTAR
jgi:hypothetical protein